LTNDDRGLRVEGGAQHSLRGTKAEEALVLAVSLRSQLEELLAEESGRKNLGGNVTSLEAMLAPGAFALLERKFTAFAFLAFHPGVDTAVADYVRGGSLSTDSGPHVLVFFMLDADASWPVPVTAHSFGDWLDVDTGVLPAQQLVRFLFEPRPTPPLPGIVIFRDLVQEGSPLYIPITATDPADIRSLCRRVFSVLESAARDARKRPAYELSKQVAVELRQDRIEFVAAGSSSAREWFVRAYQFLGDNMGDIVSLVGLAV
jgi:hypothetical protein